MRVNCTGPRLATACSSAGRPPYQSRSPELRNSRKHCPVLHVVRPLAENLRLHVRTTQISLRGHARDSLPSSVRSERSYRWVTWSSIPCGWSSPDRSGRWIQTCEEDWERPFHSL